MFPVLLIGGIGLFAGLALAVASIVMAVPKDEMAHAIQSALPGVNCGACGFSGCEGYAVALSKGEAKNGLCSPGGIETAERCAEILGLSDEEIELKTAVIHCKGSQDNCSEKMIYQGIKSCVACASLSGGVSSCRFGCMGMGDCLEACEFGAVRIENGLARIDVKKCKGCSQCVAACPKKLISLVTLKPQAVVKCSSCDKGAAVMKVCNIGCIGCKKCEKVCEYDAITVNNFLAEVNPDKCVACGKCVDVCPRMVITMIEV